MKRLGKAFVALATSLAMGAVGFAGASTAMAVETGTTDNTAITDTNKIVFNNTVKDDTFAGYRLLNLDSVSNEGGTLKVIYLLNDTYVNQIIDGIKAVESGTTLTVTSSAKDIIEWITTNLTDSSSVETFAAGFMSSKKTNPSFPAASFADQVATTGTTLEVTEQQVGYYLFEHTNVGDDDAADNKKYTKSRYMVDTLLPEEYAADGLQVTLKNGSATLTKQINEAAPTDASGKYSLGDSVPYILTGTISADYDKFDTYQYKFEDTLSGGLTPPAAADITVKIDDTAYTKVTPTVAGQKITVDLGDLKEITTPTITAATKITVEYSAVVNNDAVVKGENKATLTFSNEWNDSTKTTTTPPQKVTNFIIRLNVNKQDGEGNGLAGASFKVSRTDGKTDNTNGAWDDVQVAATGSGEFVASFGQLGAGTYKLEEVVTPSGYNTIEPITFTITEVVDQTTGEVTGLNVEGIPEGALNAGEYDVTIKNIAGSQLPSTGGMGTTILYIVGGLIVLAAAAGLTVVMRKRQK